MVMTNNNSIGIFKRIVLTLLFSVVSVFLVFPLINGFQFLKNLFNSASWKTVIGLSALNVLILIALSEKVISFWKRYYNTKKAKFSRLVFVELLGVYLVLNGFLVYFFIDNKWPTVLWLNLIIFIIWVCVTRFLGKGLLKKIGEEAAQTVSEKTLSDEPIRVSVQDRLGRGKFVYDLYRQISKLPLPLTGSFTIGLYGSWGEGKTSVLNLLEEKFENCDDFLIIRFDPRYFEDEDAIFAAFYNQIETAISVQFVFHGFKKIVERYKKIISTGLSFSGISFGLKDQNDSIEKTKEKIEDFIRRIDRKLLIIIDDIDRLQPGEA